MELLKHQGKWPKARSGHCMAFDASSGLVFLYGGYDGQYMGDMWALPLGRTEFPSLADVALEAVKRLCGAQIDELPIPEDLKQRLRFADVGKQLEWRLECNPGGEMVSYTTSGICVIGRSIFMFGGSMGSPNANDTYKYDLDERRWAKVYATGDLPVASNYSKLVAWGSQVVALNDENTKAHAQPCFHLLDTENSVWKRYPCNSVGFSFENIAIGVVEGLLCFCPPGLVELHYLPLSELSTVDENTWKKIPLEKGDVSVHYATTFWTGPHLFSASNGSLSVLTLDLAKNTGKWRSVTLVGDTLQVASSGSIMCGSASRLVIFGGHSSGYLQTTTVLDLTPDMVMAKVTNL